MSKISKTMKAELIAEHFAEQGKRLTNLKKVDVSKLDELILKHNIDIERLQKKRADIAVVEKEAKIQREKEYAEKQRINMEECKAKEEERLRLWNSITEAQQLIICEKLVVRANEEGQNKYDNDIIHTNALERKAITAGSSVVREAPTTIRINGIIVQTGIPFTPQTKEEWFSNMPQSFVYMNKYSYEFVLPDIEQMIAENAVVPEPVVCECCGASDKSVGLATGDNGVEMWVCRFCDVDGSNYNGWGDKEEEDDGFEDCNVCGYAHHYEDKCPNETTCEHYEKSEKAEAEAELVVCAYCKKPTTRCEMHWKNNKTMTELCESCVKAGIEKNPWSKKPRAKRVAKPKPKPAVAKPAVAKPAVVKPSTTYTIYASEDGNDYNAEIYCYGDLKQALNAFNGEKKRKASKKYLYKKLKLQDDKTEKEIKEWQRTKEEIVRPTFQLAELNTFNFDYTLFKHERGGFCKYAVYNNTANHYVACDFDGDKIIGWGEGTIYKTLNAWTTANWKEQRIKDGNNKTTRNNAYRETKYIPLQIIDDDELIYGPLYEEIDWQSSMTIEKK